MNVTPIGQKPQRPAEGSVPLPPHPEFTPADIAGNLAEAMKLRCIGQGQPIKASWLCMESLDLYRRKSLPPDLVLVETLEVLTLCYTDNIKLGRMEVVREVEASLAELAALGGIAHAPSLHRACTEGEGKDPAAALEGFRFRVPPGAEADPSSWEKPFRKGEAPPDGPRARTPRLGIPLVRIPREAFPLSPGSDGCVAAASVRGAAVLVPDPVRLQARYEALYLQGIVCMSQALRIERTQSAPGVDLRRQELPFLAGGAWWMHLAALVALAAPKEPQECHRRARAKASMLIRRIEAGRHFEMAPVGGPDLLE